MEDRSAAKDKQASGLRELRGEIRRLLNTHGLQLLHLNEEMGLEGPRLSVGYVEDRPGGRGDLGFFVVPLTWSDYREVGPDVRSQVVAKLRQQIHDRGAVGHA